MEVNNLKIVHIIPNLAQGGAESQLEKLVYYSKGKNVENIIVSLKNEQTPLLKKIQGSGVTVLCLDFSGFGMFLSFFKLCRLLKAFDTPTMVIQCWMYHANFFGLLAAIFTGLSNKVVWNIRRTELPSGLTGVFSKLSAKLSFICKVNIVCCAEAAKNSHVDAGYNSENMLVFHNGIDVEQFQPSNKNKKLFRKELGLSESDFIIGMVGRYAPIKGHLYLLQAFKHVVDNNKPDRPSIKLVLIGRGIDNADVLQPLLNDPKLREHLVVVSERTDIYRVMPSFDLLCLPSKSEGFPNVVAEAMSSGVPALVTDVGDAALIVGTKEMVIPLENAEIVSDKLINFSKLPSNRKSLIAFEARERVIEHFSIGKAWKSYSSLYKKIIEKIN
ncbi:glycosyltransferase [Vibrio cyclitrophicus]